jgi:hypothetical protein
MGWVAYNNDKSRNHESDIRHSHDANEVKFAADEVGIPEERIVRIMELEKRPKWGARDLPFMRQVAIDHTLFSQKIDSKRFEVPNPPPADLWEMYYATGEFADLHAEMHRDFEWNNDYVRGCVKGIVDARGPSGSIVVAFDPFNMPTCAVSALWEEWPIKQENMDEYLASDWSMSAHPTDTRLLLSKMKVATLQWWVSPNADGGGTWHAFAQTLSPGGTWRTSPFGSPTCAEVILIAFMLVNEELRMLNREEIVVSAGLPPKVKAQMRKKDRQSKVTVVNLRAVIRKQLEEVRESEDQAARHLHHRFVVRGHWRNQAVGVGRTDHRLTYIAPFVKGPEGAPFVGKDKVLKW